MMYSDYGEKKDNIASEKLSVNLISFLKGPIRNM
jgi:hypothetical protein